VNPAAGGGRCGQEVDVYVDRLQRTGLAVARYITSGPGEATKMARRAVDDGADPVIAVGGDGTLFEVLNGLFPGGMDRPALGVLPLGTGNSFVRDFDLDSPRKALNAIMAGHRRPVDVVRVVHAGGELHYINLLSVGFTARAGSLTNRRFKRLGAAGYVASVLACLVRLEHPVFPVALDEGAMDRSPCSLLSFSNSRYTGGEMMMAPAADPTDGRLDVIRVGALSRLRFLRTFPEIFDGTHTSSPGVTATTAATVQFDLPGPVDVMVDGEVLSLHLERLEVLPGAVDFLA